MNPWLIIIMLAVLAALAVVLWRGLTRWYAFPCPTQFLWLVENRAMERVAGSALLLDRAGVASGMTVLDAGCGPGRLTLPLAGRVGPDGSVLAVDIQEGMLARLLTRLEAANLTNVRTLRAALGSGMLPAATFDRAVLVTVLGEIPDRVGALREILSSLKPGGILSVTEVFPDPHYQTRGVVRRLAGQAGFEVRDTFGSWRAFTINLARPARKAGAD